MKKIISWLFKFIKNNFLLVLAVMYLFWPIDIIPDFLGIIGGPIPFTDDGAVLLSALAVKFYKDYKKSKEEEKLLAEGKLEEIQAPK